MVVSMNREDIIQMAHESHLDVYGLGKDYAKFADALERFAALVASAEREACAKVCETFDQREAFNDEDMAVADACANAIRARGQP
jgi:hypothetical protein